MSEALPKMEFDEFGYTVIRSFIPKETAVVLHRYSLDVAMSGHARFDKQVPGTPSAYGDPMMEKVLERLRPKVESAVGQLLYPTYSYFRVYKNGDALPKHKDRAACEISLSLCLGYEASEPWPLFVKGPNGVFAANLEQGDGLIYKGIERMHWREPFAGKSNSQVFLHYVAQDGPHAEWRFDKRADLNRGRSQPVDTCVQSNATG
jgi:alkylated DNA repair dioxygenase AlkB